MIPLLVGLGLIFGSFINAFVWRLHEGKGWINARSECPHCHKVLAPKDLVPVLSWLWLRGRCCYCGKPIPDSPLVELVMPLLFVASYVFWPYDWDIVGVVRFIIWLVMLIGFVALAVYDLRWYLLPNKVVFPLIGLGLLQVGILFGLTGEGSDALQALAGATVLSGLFYLLFQLSRGKWIGGGDVKLAIVLGLLAGHPLSALLVIFIASVTGTIISLPLLVQGKVKGSSHLPFGPLLIFGIIIVQLWGTSIIDWYRGLFAV